MGFGESLELVRPADPIAVWGWEWPNHLAGWMEIEPAAP